MKCAIQASVAITALFSLMTLPVSSLAQTTFYSQRTDFVTASGTLQTIDFENLATPGSFVNYGLGGSYANQGVTFTVSGGDQLFVNSATYYTNTYTLGAGDYLVTGPPLGASATAFLTITMPSDINSIGFDLGTFDFPSSQILVTLANGSQRTLSAPYPTVAFYGVTTDSPIASLTLQITGGDRKDVLALDTFQFGRALPGQTPAPSALFPMILGGVLIIGTLKRRKRP